MLYVHVMAGLAADVAAPVSACSACRRSSHSTSTAASSDSTHSRKSCPVGESSTLLHQLSSTFILDPAGGDYSCEIRRVANRKCVGDVAARSVCDKCTHAHGVCCVNAKVATGFCHRPSCLDTEDSTAHASLRAPRILTVTSKPPCSTHPHCHK